VCGNSALFDVAIIDENNIWAVGEIYMRDSLGRCDPNAYNAVHWDGSKWELKRIYHYSSCNPVDYPPFSSIIAFSEKDIVLTSGGSIGWFNGKTNRTDCGIRPLLTGAINKLWGTSSNDLYAVGDYGNIAHWNGSRWTKIESGTDVRLTDVWGNIRENTVYVSGYNVTDGRSLILKIEKGGTTRKIYEVDRFNPRWDTRKKDTLCGMVSSIWINSKSVLWSATTSGVYRTINFKEKNIDKLSWEPNYIIGFLERIRGTSYNNIFVCGHFGTLAHWNGNSWKHFTEFLSWDRGLKLKSLDTKDNLVVIVGDNKIIVGKSN